MMEEIELKPCPFCGGKATLVYVDGEKWQVICDDCGSCSDCYYEEGSSDNPPEWKKAIEAWNTRKIEDAQAERIKHLQKERAEAIEQNYKNAFYIQMQAERGAKYALKENARLWKALEEIKKTVECAQDTVYPFHIALDSKDGMYILEVAKEALKRNEK